MSSSTRQSELFAGADWTALYRAFTEVNFNASDPVSINAALRNYIQQNYPENFNDWIESSEFVMLIDLLSWLAGTLAFKTDINGHEAFIETAAMRQSLLRLARFISYNPSRNQCAQGIVKLSQVKTNDDVYDAFGTNLNGATIIWDNPDDPDWFERFVAIMNNAFIPTNQFGVPLQSGSVGAAATQLYRFNNVMSQANLGFSAQVGGNSMNFEIVNPGFNDGGGFYEITPDYNNALNLFYLNDGNGNSSPQTGFFFMFKQGTLQNALFNIGVPIENNVLPITTTGVNNTDVWVQTVDDAGNVLINWNQVPAIFSQNITYNNYDPSIRNIYSVITQDNDAISIRFSDGRFGAVPTGNIRIFYRTSNGLQYKINPTDIDNIQIVLPYFNASGVSKNITLTFSLEQTVSNSTPRETDDQIRQRAPAVYATQNRMVSGQDYNVFPLQSNLAVKIKALNRVYSGHSRFIDLNDPTGNYQDVNVYSDDGIFFREQYNIDTLIPPNFAATAASIINLYVQPLMSRTEVINYGNDYLLANYSQSISNAISWNLATSEANFSSSGNFSSFNQYIIEGAQLKFLTNTGVQWASVAGVTGSITAPSPTGTAGPVTLSVTIPTGSTVETIIPAYLSGLNVDAINSITTCIGLNQSFTVWYDYTGLSSPWVINPVSVTGTMFLVLTGTYSNGGLWSLSANGIRYVFESLKNVQWYNDGRRTMDSQTGEEVQDLIRIMKINEDYNDMIANTPSGRGFKINYDLDLDHVYYNRDGSVNPKRATVQLSDANLNGYADVPDTFYRVCNNNGVASPENYLFWQHDETYGDIPNNSMIVFVNEADRHNTVVVANTVTFQINGTLPAYNNTFWLQTDPNGLDTGWALQRSGAYSYAIGRGSNIAKQWFTANSTVANTIANTTTLSNTPASQSSISFLWKHYASTDQRVDPARTNINDVFVLTSEYDYLVRLWINNGADPTQIPTAPTELDLRLAFEAFEDYKMFSDQIIWRPVSYKYLFGPGADDTLQGTFMVIPTPTSTLSDGEIQTQVVRAINAFFAANLWEFGEPFFASELSAYIHSQLATEIASVVLVPTYAGSYFGDNYEVQCSADQIFISTAQVSNVQIISANTSALLRIR